jgi:ATP-dependent DNA helicase RecG
LEESIANSLYHRSWDVREPVEIRILPNCIEIINQGGPDRSVKMDDIKKGVIHNRRYRNRRIGDFLKELDMTEGRGTGIPIIRKEMKRNGSPEPRFETGDDYSYFITTLPIHPLFLANDGVSGGVDEAINEPIKTTKTIDSEGATIYRLIDELINEPIKKELAQIIELILSKRRVARAEIFESTPKSIATVKRYLKLLKDNGLIEYIGSNKTGSYYLTAMLNRLINE